MKILIVGNGGREHTIAWKLKQSTRNPEIYAAPGNAGISQVATCVDIAVDDVERLIQFAIDEKIDLTVVGPELPLVMGLVDAFEENGLKVIGPNKKAAQFEGSKDFTKAFLKRHGIPTAAYETYTEFHAALEGLNKFSYPVVIKADGLAAGKGVVIAQNYLQASDALKEMMEQQVFGAAGSKVVIEAFLKGIEASILCFVDGETILPMSPAQDYKKAFDGDAGLNTGGMGTYSPSQIIDEPLMQRIQNEILEPFIKGIKKEDIHFKGILFVGIMIDGDSINVVEYNVRLGDPETEVTLTRLENDLIDVFEAILETKLSEVKLKWSSQHAVCVIMASGGYPSNYEKGFPITGLNTVKDSIIFHCGTKSVGGQVVTNGGRVLGVTALGDSLEMAQKKAYKAVSEIAFEGGFYRTDIGELIY